MDYKELWEGKTHIGTDTKTDSDVYFDTETGTFFINVIDAAGNRWNKLQVNTIDDVLAKFPNWKWTEQGKATFGDTLDEASAYDSLAGILKQLGAEEDSIKVLIKAVEMGALKPSDAVTIVKKALGVKESTDDTDFDSDTTGAQGLQSSNPLPPSTLKEARYSEFKQMTKVRTPGEQLHRAIREIRRKIDEINKLVSYTEKMKTEMKSDVNEVNYLKRTKEALAKISARIQETNNKIKRLVQ